MRIVFREEVTRDDLDDAIAARRFRIANVISATAKTPSQMVLLSEDRGDVMQVVEDDKIGFTYAVIAGGDPDRAERSLRDALPTYGAAEIRALLDAPEDVAQHVRGVKLAALALPPSEANAALKAARAHADRAVRDAASLALAYVDVPLVAPRPRVT